MRVAFVGLSTPLFYDYRNPAGRAIADMQSSPNPILDSPFGIFLLFDEIWFLCRSLCPKNMRDLPYVKFLDESGKLPSLSDCESKANNLAETVTADPGFYKQYQEYYDTFKIYRETVKRVGIHWEAAPDNHTHGLKIGDIQTSANSISLRNLFFDIEIVNSIGKKNVELITNSFSQRFLEEGDNPILKAKLAELLVIDNIPNYLSPQGPYHPCVEEARNNPYLKDFRKWVSAQPVSPDANELLDIKKEVEAAIQKSQDEIFLKYLDRKTQYFSVGRKLAAAAADIFVPGASTVATVLEELSNFFEKGERRWQGFIVSIRRQKTRG